MEAFMQEVEKLAMTYGLKILAALVILVVGFYLVRLVMRLIEKAMDRHNGKVDPSVRSFTLSLANIVLKILVVVAIVGVLGVPTTSFAAVIGSVGLAIGLALQGSLSNFAGGILLLVLKPFAVGDYIEGAGHSGTVSSITIFYTYLTTIDNKIIMVPNGQLSNNSIINYTRNATRRVDMVFGVSYESDITQVKTVLREILDRHEKILGDPEPFVRLTKHNESSLDFTIRAWTKTEDYWPVYFDLTEQVKEAFDREGIEIPYPHRVQIIRNEQQTPSS